MSESRPPSDPELELLAQALRAGAADASTPEAVDQEALDAHERALARAFGLDAGSSSPVEDTEAPATDAERAAIAAGHHDELVAALRAADDPRPLAASRHEPLIQRSLASRPKRRVSAAWAAGSALAVAAAVLLALRVSGGTTDSSTARALDPETALSRSTETLVASAAADGTSTRVDRIAQARSGDYRRNRFRTLGAR